MARHEIGLPPSPMTIAESSAQSGAYILNTPRAELPSHESRDTAELVARAERIVTRLDDEIQTSERWGFLDSPAGRAVKQSLDANAPYDPNFGLLNSTMVRFDSLAQALVVGRPIEAVTAIFSAHRPSDPSLDVGTPYDFDPTLAHSDSSAQAWVNGRPVETRTTIFPTRNPGEPSRYALSEAERQGVQISKFLRFVAGPHANAVRHNILTLYEPDDSSRFWTPGAHAEQTHLALHREGLFRGDDRIGQQVYFETHSIDDRAAIAELEARLDDSPYGSIRQVDELTTFWPHPEYVEWVTQTANEKLQFVQRLGLPICAPGIVTESALLAASMLGKDPRAVRLAILEESGERIYRNAYTLSRLAGGGGHELSQAIFYEANCNSDVVAYALARLLRPYVAALRDNIGRYAAPERYSAEQYNGHNYRASLIEKEQKLLAAEVDIPGILPEDIICRRTLLTLLAEDCRPGQFGDMVDLYCGPGTSLPRILEPYLAPGATIFQRDRSPTAIEYQKRWKAATLDPDDADIARRDLQLLATHPTGHLYVGQNGGPDCDERARARAQAELGDSRDFPADFCDILADGYGSCSTSPDVDNDGNPIPPTYEDFVKLQRDKYRILRPDGKAVSFHMLYREHWESVDALTSEPIFLPSVFLTPDDLENAYREAGFTNVRVVPVKVKNPHHAGAAMAVVLADKPKGSVS